MASIEAVSVRQFSDRNLCQDLTPGAAILAAVMSEMLQVRYTAELPGPPTTLHLFYNDGGESGEQVGN